MTVFSGHEKAHTHTIDLPGVLLAVEVGPPEAGSVVKGRANLSNKLPASQTSESLAFRLCKSANEILLAQTPLHARVEGAYACSSPCCLSTVRRWGSCDIFAPLLCCLITS